MYDSKRVRTFDISGCRSTLVGKTTQVSGRRSVSATKRRNSPQNVLNNCWNSLAHVRDNSFDPSGRWRRNRGHQLRFELSNALTLFTFFEFGGYRNVEGCEHRFHHPMQFEENSGRVFGTNIITIRGEPLIIGLVTTFLR